MRGTVGAMVVGDPPYRKSDRSVHVYIPGCARSWTTRFLGLGYRLSSE